MCRFITDEISDKINERQYIVEWDVDATEVANIAAEIVLHGDYKFAIVDKTGKKLFSVDGYEPRGGSAVTHLMEGLGEAYERICTNDGVWFDFEYEYCDIEEDEDGREEYSVLIEKLEAAIVRSAFLPQEVHLTDYNDLTNLYIALDEHNN